MHFRFPALLCLIVLICTGGLRAQFTTASLGGTVVDPVGSAVPQANVKVENVETGLTQTAATGLNGQFVFPTLPVGRYRLTIEKPGFTSYVQEGIQLTVNQAATQTITLKVGAVSESVTVSADAELVSTRSAESGQLVDQRKITDLPLNGRQAQSLIYLAPGTIDTTNRYCGVNCFGGVYPGEQQAAVNGTGPSQVNYQLDGAGHNDTYLNMNLPFPNPDAVQEFKLDANNMSAQFGNSAGGVVNIVTRSGTNGIHGDLFEFLRNGALNARNFFAPTHDTLNRNQFGGSVGGPVIKNKLFYFGTYQGTRIRSAPQGQIGFVPTAAERTGDFSGLLPGTQLKDPVTGALFPNNQIPASRLSPITQQLLKYIPLPTGPGRQLTFVGPPVKQNDDQYMGKADFNLGRHQVSARYFDTQFTQNPTPFTNNLLQSDGGGNTVHIRNAALNDTLTLRPTLLFNTWFGWNSQTGGAVPSAIFGWNDLGVKIATPEGEPPESYLSIGGAFTANTNWKGAFDRGDWTVREDVTWVKGSHELHAGSELVRLEKHIVNTYRMGGFFTFNNNLTGDNLADFYIGRVSNFTQGGGEFTYLTGTRWSSYVQDNWRVNQRLTVNLGLRWEPFFPFQEQQGRVTCFQPGVKSTNFVNAPAGLTVGGDPGCPDAGTDNRLANFAPRVGFAYRVTQDGKTAVRGGVGYYLTQFSSDSFTQQTNSPFSPQYFLLGVDFQDPYGSAGIPNPFPAQYALHLPAPDVAFIPPVGLANTLPRHVRIPLVTQWNLFVERQVLNDLLLRVGYVGNKGTQMGPSDFFKSTQELNPAVYIPGASTPSNTQSRRPLQQFSSVTQIANGNNTHYNSLQVIVEKRFSHGLSILSNYTWSKTIDDFGWTDPYWRGFDRGVSDDNVPHAFKFAAVYQIPHARVARAVGALVNGWELTANTLWRSGFPLTIRSGFDNSLTGVGRDRADFLGGNAQLSFDRSHADMIRQWFNTSAFAANAPGTFGNSGKNILKGPRMFNTDFGLLKNTRLIERASLQFRAEFFNIFNNVNFNNPGTTVSATSSFGRITSAGSPRIIQFGAKLIF